MVQADVVVVGAGPAGAVTALLLARHGHAVVLLDRAHFPRPKTCAEYMSPGLVAALHGLGLGGVLASPAARPVDGMDIVSPRGTRFPVRYGSAGNAPQAVTLPRLQLDAALVHEAVAAGVELHEGVVARLPLLTDGSVAGIEGLRDGRTAQYRAPLTVFADGGQSIGARRLGLSHAARWPRRLGLVAHYAGGGALPAGSGEMHVDTGGYCGIAPLPDGMLNVAVVVREGMLRATGLTATAFFERWVETHPAVRRALQDTVRQDTVRGIGPIGTRARCPGTRGALLVGDAAGFFDPFTGEGMHRAVLGARLAADAATEALTSGDTGESMVRAYQQARRRAFRKKEYLTVLVQLFVQFPHLMEYALPRLAARPTPRAALSLALGDVGDPGAFLAPRMLWSALRP